MALPALIPLVGRILITNWQYVIIAVLFAYIGWLNKITIPNLEEEIKEQKQEYSKLETKYEVLQGAANLCSGKVSDLEKRGKELQDGMIEVAKRAAESRSITGAQVNALLSAKVPQDCDGAVKWLATEAKRISDDWKSGGKR